MTHSDTAAGTAAQGDLARDDVDEDAAARGVLYSLFAAAFDEPNRTLYDALADASLAAEIETILDRTTLSVDVPALSTDDDHDLLCARFNDVFDVGHVSTGGIDEPEGGPPVSLYESDYRDDASWQDVNMDLARAYDYYGLEVDEERREHHDHLRLQLEFAGYLARRAATGDDDAAAARRDFLERHLRVLADGMADRIADEVATGPYDGLVALLDAFTTADHADLDAGLGGEQS